MPGESHGVRVGIVLEVDENPLSLYVWAHLVAETMVGELTEHGIVASVLHIDIDDHLSP